MRASIACVLVASGVLASAVPGRAAYVWDQHLHGSDVRDLVATGDALWLGTLAGLVRMDLSDSSLTVFRRDDRGLPSDSINTLALDAGGNLWCGTESAGIVIRRAMGGWDFVRTFDGLPSVRVLSLASFGSAMTAGTGEGFAIFDGDDVTGCTVIDPCVDELPSLAIQCVLTLAGETWFGTAEGPARRSESGIEAFTAGLGALSVVSLAAEGAEIWCGTTDGPYRFDATTESWSRVDGATVVLGEVIVDLLPTPEGMTAAVGSGVHRWSGTDWEALGSAFSTRGAARALARAPGDGTLWCGTADGIRSYDPGAKRWSSPIRVPGLNDPRPVWSIGGRPPDLVAIGYRGPLGAVLERGAWRELTSSSTGGGFEPRHVQVVYVDGLGRTWFGHCCCQDPGCFADRLTRGPGGEEWARVPAMNSRAIVGDGAGFVFFGSGAEDPSVVGGGLAIWHESLSADSVFVIDDDTFGYSLTSNTITGLAIGPLGRLWIGTRQNGVDVWSYGSDPFDTGDDSWTHLAEGNPSATALISDDVLGIAARGPRVWIGTAAGVTLYENGIGRGSWGPSTLGNPFVTAVAVTADGSGWGGTPEGIVRFVPNALGVFDVERYAFPELSNDAINAIAAVGNTVWVASDRGVSIGRPTLGPDEGGVAVRVGSAYPNPFRPRQHDGVRLVDVAGPVDGEVYDAAGALVARFTSVDPGEVVWSGRIEVAGGAALAAPGIYAIVARGESLTLTARVALVR